MSGMSGMSAIFHKDLKTYTKMKNILKILYQYFLTVSRKNKVLIEYILFQMDIDRCSRNFTQQ